MIGKTISHYEIIEKLGGGGMGVVYKAKDTKLDRFVALKFLPPHVSDDDEEKQRFIHEAKAAAKLEHNNICNVYEIDETDDGQMFIAMACYEGETLKKRIEKGPLKLEEALDIAIQAAEGLKEAHGNDIVHRDIKPANIFITSKNVVKILDFGLAKLAGQSKITKEGSTLGTTSYMSPEQAKGEEADHHTDIWSLGVVLYEMITGQKPFKGAYDQSVLYAIMNEAHEPVTGLRTGIPMELERLIDKTLKKNPDERYQTVSDVLVDLKAVRQDTEPTMKVRPAEAKGKPEKKKSLRKVIIPVVAVLILVLAVLMLRSFIAEEVLGSAPVPIAVLPFENKTGEDGYDHLRGLVPNLFISKLEQSKYLRITTWERMRDLLKQTEWSDHEVENIDTDIGFKLCSNDGVGAAVTGSISKLGNQFAVEIKVLDVDSKAILKSAIEYGEAVESIYKIIDKLSNEISRGIGLSETKVAAIEQPLTEVTTSSIDAYNYFLRGREESRKLRYEDAQRLLEMAIELDSTFAMAHYQLVHVYYRLGNSKAQYEAIAKAKIHSYRATEKERMYIEARYASLIEKNVEKEMVVYEQMAKKYPNEKGVFVLLGDSYTEEKDRSKRIEIFEKALKLDPNHTPTLVRLVYSHMFGGEYEEALEYCKRYVSVSPGDPNPLDTMAELYFHMGRLDDAIIKYKEAMKVEPGWGLGRNIAYMYALKEQYSDVMSSIDQYINQQRQGRRAEGQMMKGFYCYLLGNYERSFDELGKAKELYDQLGNESRSAGADWMMGWIYADMEEYDLARKYVVGSFRIKMETEPQYYNLYTSRQHFNLGMIDLQEGRIDSAKINMTEAISILPRVEIAQELFQYRFNIFRAMVFIAENRTIDAFSILKEASFYNVPALTMVSRTILYNLPFMEDALGQAYHQAGELDKAITEYERITRFNPDSKDRLLIHPKYHYRLAKLYEEKGLKDKAIERYEKFLDIWKDADEDLPEKQDAKVRLAKLKG